MQEVNVLHCDHKLLLICAVIGHENPISIVRASAKPRPSARLDTAFVMVSMHIPNLYINELFDRSPDGNSILAGIYGGIDVWIVDVRFRLTTTIYMLLHLTTLAENTDL